VQDIEHAGEWFHFVVLLFLQLCAACIFQSNFYISLVLDKWQHTALLHTIPSDLVIGTQEIIK